MTAVRVLRHRGVAAGLVLPPEIAESVEIMDIAEQCPLPAGLRADALLTSGWRGAKPNLYDAVEQARVRWVHLTGAGVEHLDLRRLCADGRVVTNAAGAAAVPVAEWTVATLLAFEKQLPETWLDEAPHPCSQHRSLGTLYASRLAILGLGAIGTALAQRAIAFGASVRALRRTLRPASVPGVEVVGSLPELLADADHLVLTAPLTPLTRRIIDAHAFGLMAPGVHVVNVARGGLIDHDALRSALDDQVVARASLDVTDPEPLPPGHWLYRHPRVRLTPHVSYRWPGHRHAQFNVFVDNLRTFLRGAELPHRVDPHAGY